MSLEIGTESVSVVIPCHNEAESLPTLFARVSEMRRSLDGVMLVLVDDGSSDGTGELLRAEFGGDPDVRVVSHDVRLGYGGALKVGLDAADGDIVVTIDADTNYDIRNIKKLLEALGNGADMVTASPFMDGGAWNYPFRRFVMSRVLVTLYRMALWNQVGDIMTFTCGFRAYRRTILAAVRPDADDFLANAEILVRALVLGLTVAQAPATVFDREHGRSKLKTVPIILRHLGFLWKLLLRRVEARPVEHPEGQRKEA
ncbi:MAG: glycosyltransferase family 2 protein [Alphaproteobacteria bacterium]|nr:glycosyltransferase family 2 protein [Alphaproteobacteria bacterium]